MAVRTSGTTIVKLSLDSARFESGMGKFEKQMTKLQASKLRHRGHRL